MAVTVRIPTPLQEFTQNQDAVEIDGSTVKEVLGNLDDQFDGMRQRLYDEEGKLRRRAEPGTFEYQHLEQMPVVVDGDPPLGVVISQVERV